MKKRADLQVVAYRIDKAIREGRASALPIYPVVSGWRGPGRMPTVILLLEPLRLRLPPVHTDGPRRYRIKHEKPWGNRTTIHRSVLNCRFVGVGRTAPDYQRLLTMDNKDRLSFGVVTVSRGMRRRIYEVVDDLSHGLRQVVHVQSQYHREIAYLESVRARMLDRQRQERSGIARLGLQERETARLTLLETEKRLAEIDTICQDRAARGYRLRYYSRLSSVQLFEMAESLSSFRSSVARMVRVNFPATRSYLEGLVQDLELFSSREVRTHLLKAIRRLRWIVQNEVSRATLLALLDASVEHLKVGAVALSYWADSLATEERQLALL